MGFFQPGDLPPRSSCRQIYHVGVKGGTPAEEREISVWAGVQLATPRAGLLLRVFFSSF